MTIASRQFIIRILVFTTIIFVVASALFMTVLETWYLASYPYLLLFIASITTIGHLWIVRASGQNSRKFNTAYMGAVTLKLMVYLTFMLAYLLIDRSQAITFVLTFVTFYILFTGFEVIQVLNAIKKQS